jgi:hypothetical protein
MRSVTNADALDARQAADRGALPKVVASNRLGA